MPATKEMVEKTIQKLYSDKVFYEQFAKQYDVLFRKTIRKYASLIQCENSTGDYLQSCKNCSQVFQGVDCEDCRYTGFSVNLKDCCDSTAHKA